MIDLAKEIVPVNIEDELKQSYLGYAMSVIVGRALPDVRDGLKPVHRRVLYAMHELGNDWNKPYKKSARIVGDVIGKYHPHGDSAVYDTIVRMAQPFSLRYLLVDGQGNFGSIDGDKAAAMRYTEIRMTRAAHALMADLEKETVDFVANYDESEFAPSVLPTRIPNLLINGSSGIAVGMATNIPPHNLGEVINACLALIDDPDITIDGLIEHIPGPDFPTAGIINGRAGILQAYRTGRGRIYVRAKTHIEGEMGKEKQTIVIDELPYQVNKARLIEKIAELVKDKKIEGITGLRDESDKDGMRVAIELRRGEVADVVLNNLYSHTPLQSVFGINMVALVEGRPGVLNLKQLLEAFLRHRREVVTRRTIFELRKARERAHILEGLAIALSNIDAIIALIKSSASPAEAKERLLAQIWKTGLVTDMLQRAGAEAVRPDELPEHFGLSASGYRLSPQQCQAILELRLHRLTGLEQDKILDEYQTLIDAIQSLLLILSNPEVLLNVIRDELQAVSEQFADPRRTFIQESQEDLTIEDLITEEERVVTLSHEGYVKTQSLDVYQAQRRGGRGKSATEMKEEDFIAHLLVASSHATLLCFSNEGKVYWIKVYQLPQAGRNARGRPIVNLLPLIEGERITAIMPLPENPDDASQVIMATALGTVKRVALKDFSRPRSTGLIAVDLIERDELVAVSVTQGDQHIMLFSDAGKVICFHEGDVRSMGRSARGVRGIRLSEGQRVISLIVVEETGDILTATANGYGKRTPVSEYRITGRGGQGVISIQVTERNGPVIGATQVHPKEDIMLISNQGTLVRTRVEEISVVGRNTQGVRLIKLADNETLVGLQRIGEFEASTEEDETESLSD